MVIGSAIGPAMFAALEAATDSYRPALWASATLPAIGLLLTVTQLRADDARRA